VKAYDETFSDEEVDAILAFYETPAGRAMVAKTPALLAKSVSIVQSQMGDLTPDIERLAKEILQK